ncbi:MAG: P27 family phage terminase small subunit [Sulfuricurvum sp.]|uniref:P27 family phage terminase small subunit n=1 Tax=Sulfuricurvum sp. TaxID=2025608 RepID=UPI00260A8CCF|nr:P27 family phage terminase small subunit [Sulfuricurvum sp.]MDD5159676.1 P27 family phage terminase small subunit [Sulfuricurvum sp.]
METETIDWDEIKKDFLGGKFRSVNALASHYKVSRPGIMKKSKKEEWGDFVPLSKNMPVSTIDKSVTNPYIDILGPIALRKIEQLKQELGNHYSNVDEPMIVCYAKTYERWLALEIKMMDQEEVLESEKTGSKYINPLYNVIQMTIKTLTLLSSQLGVSMPSRHKMNIKIGEHEGQLVITFASQVSGEVEMMSETIDV